MGAFQVQLYIKSNIIWVKQVIILEKTAEQAWEPFRQLQQTFADFRDALFGPCTYKCTVIIEMSRKFIIFNQILECLRGLEYAIKLKWFNVKTFNLQDYEFHEKVENGDSNWIIPGKFMAFSGPSSSSRNPQGVTNLIIIFY